MNSSINVNVRDMGDMIIHPINNDIVSVGDCLMYPNWKRLSFINATNCEMIEVKDMVILYGEVEGKTFTSALSERDYFDGKFFKFKGFNGE